MNTPNAHQEEFGDLVALLFEHAAHRNQDAYLIARIVARACMGPNHLWQDLGLPNRQALNHLMRDCFPALHAKNTSNMRWKKFFYRHLCERADIPVCQSPTCTMCCDYSDCFGEEDENHPHLPHRSMAITVYNHRI